MNKNIDKNMKLLRLFCGSKDDYPVPLFKMDKDCKKLLFRFLTKIKESGLSSSPRLVLMLDSLSSTSKSDGDCDKLAPLRWVGDSCYLDSVLFALLAVPNKFISESITKSELQEENKLTWACSQGVFSSAKKDLVNRKRVQKVIARISRSIQSGGKIKYCTALRDLFRLCPSIDNYHLTGPRDAGAFLQYFLNLFPGANRLTMETTVVSGSGRVTRYIYRDHSIIINVPYSKVSAKKQTNIREFLTETDSVITEDNKRVETHYVYKESPYVVFNIMRRNPAKEELEKNWFSRSKVIPTPTLSMGGRRLTLSAVVVWVDFHYTAYVRCGNNFYFYDDTEPELLTETLSFKQLFVKSELPSITTNGTLFFYA